MANVLIVEDDADAAGTLADALGLIGHDTSLAFDGEQGLQRMKERPPDLVLLDVEMPKLSGPEVAIRMLVHDAGLETIPVVLLSGTPALRQIAAQLRTPYLLAKPYHLEALFALVERALHERALVAHLAVH